MPNQQERERSRIREIAELLHQAAAPIQVLSLIAWPPEVKARFFAQKERELPQVRYPDFDPAPTIELVRRARQRIVPVSAIDLWLDRQAQSVEGGARMLAGRGTHVFFDRGRDLYGEPSQPLRYLPLTSLDLAHRIHEAVEGFARVDVSFEPLPPWDADQVARALEEGVAGFFGDEAPTVEVVDVLSANALAATTSIKVRRGARFTERAAAQLLEHEAFVHIATSLNGRAQTDLPILGDSHPITNRTQEGLAVLAELVSGTLELERLRRLADRVVAIQMAIEGADFLEVYRWFAQQTGDADQAFENTRRVFRGGVLEGGAPFTKDVVYLFGLLQVSNAVRAAFATGRPDCIPLLFCGKLDVVDLPALAELAAMGMCKMPRYMPAWLADPRFLLSFLTFSTFASGVDERPLFEAARRLLEGAPIVHVAPVAA